jgi:hypothetical protein
MVEVTDSDKHSSLLRYGINYGREKFYLPLERKKIKTLLTDLCTDIMEQRALKNVNNCLNTNIYSYFETSDCQSLNLYLKVVPFLTPVLMRHLWQLKTVVFLHWCLICAVLLTIIRLC